MRFRNMVISICRNLMLGRNLPLYHNILLHRHITVFYHSDIATYDDWKQFRYVVIVLTVLPRFVCPFVFTTFRMCCLEMFSLSEQPVSTFVHSHVLHNHLIFDLCNIYDPIVCIETKKLLTSGRLHSSARSPTHSLPSSLDGGIFFSILQSVLNHHVDMSWYRVILKKVSFGISRIILNSKKEKITIKSKEKGLSLSIFMSPSPPFLKFELDLLLSRL